MIIPLRILAIDPAMANVGWMVLDMHPDGLSPSLSPTPDWITSKDTTGTHSYHCFVRHAGGVFSTNNSITVHARLISQVDSIHNLVSTYKPDLLAFETQLEASGGRRGFSGGAQVVLGMMFPYFNICDRPVRLFRCPDFQYLTNPTHEMLYELEHFPLYGVCFHPSQINSMAHYERTTKDKTVVERYRHLTQATHRLSVHEADAYFIGVHAGRFWATCLEGCWGRKILTKKEQAAFLTPGKGILDRKLDYWWTNFCTQEISHVLPE